MDCIFCKIIKKEIPSKIVYEDEKIIGFEDINPMAPIHILIIPKEHIPMIDDVEEKHSKLIGDMILVAKNIAKKKGLSEKNGYRLVFNNGKDAGQEVFHIHLHLLGGRKFGWPPG